MASKGRASTRNADRRVPVRGGQRPLRGLVVPRRRLHAGIEQDAGAALSKEFGRSGVELAQRHRAHAHAAGLGRIEEQFPDHLGRIRQRDRVDVRVQCAGDHQPPESVEGSFRLLLARQPRAQALGGIVGDGAHEGAKGAPQGQLVLQGVRAGRQETWKAVKRGGEPRRPERRAPPSRLDHGHIAGPADAVGDPDAPVEAGKVGAAAEEHVLAIVDDFADTRMEMGRGPSAEVGTPLDQLDAQPGFGQGAGGAHAGNPPAHNGDSSLHFVVRQKGAPAPSEPGPRTRFRVFAPKARWRGAKRHRNPRAGCA